MPAQGRLSLRGEGVVERLLPTADVVAGFRQEEPDTFHPSLV